MRAKKRGIHSRIKKHPWDETMVIAVMITAVLCILILLASYMNVLGMAWSALPSKEGSLNMLGECEMVSGEAGGNMGEWKRGTNCKSVCAKIRKTSILAMAGEEFELKRVGDKRGSRLTMEKYNCLCCSS